LGRIPVSEKTGVKKSSFRLLAALGLGKPVGPVALRRSLSAVLPLSVEDILCIKNYSGEKKLCQRICIQ
jgi:hypothetical protein